MTRAEGRWLTGVTVLILVLVETPFRLAGGSEMGLRRRARAGVAMTRSGDFA
jgi:hypothetical protein